MYRGVPLCTYFTDLCWFLISFGFQVHWWRWGGQSGMRNLLPRAVNLSYRTGALNGGLEWALKPVMYSVGNVPSSIPGHLHWKMFKGKNPTQIWTGDPQITRPTLNHCAMLACLFWIELIGYSYWLHGWGRGIKSVYTQIRTRDTQVSRPALYHWARQAANLGPMYIKPPMDVLFIRPCT